jgi:outer membrane protein assembly factor BamA
MIKFRIALVFILFTLCSSSITFSQTEDSTRREKKLKIIPLPALFYTPETRLGFGSLTSGVFNLGDKATTRNSNVQVLGAYTLNKQIIFRTYNTIFTKDEQWAFNGELSYYDFPIFYYGIGNDTDADFEEDLGYQVIIFRERMLRKLKPSFFAGVQYRYTNLYDLRFEPEFLIEDKPVLESQTGANSGFGVSFIYDNRDNVLNATKGLFIELSNFIHHSGIGSDFDYNRFTLDIRKFWPITDKAVIAAQYLGEFNDGEVPFREMALLGGESIMRGYYNGRFRDKQQMAIQTEYRQQILPWIGITAFGAVGDVADNMSNFSPSEFKWAAGAGLRFMVNKSDRLNIRIDYGIGENISGFYFAFAEAF